MNRFVASPLASTCVTDLHRRGLEAEEDSPWNACQDEARLVDLNLSELVVVVVQVYELNLLIVGSSCCW